MDAGGNKNVRDDARTLIVISDLHIGAGALDDFDVPIELEFTVFIGDISQRPAPVELVINGDFLEFVQAVPWEDAALRSVTAERLQLCFTQPQSVEKLESIIRHHPNVFKALGWFLAKPANRLVILPGNHDADLFWPDVRARLRAILDETAGAPVGDRLVLHLDRVYRPPQMPGVWIEHGHQYDTNNRFYFDDGECWSDAKPPIVQVDGTARLLACVGTQFLCDYLNKLDETHPFVDNVKPFSKFVKMFLVGSALFRFGTPVRAAVAAWGILRFLAKLRQQSLGALLSEGGRDVPSVAEAVRDAWKELPEPQQDAFVNALECRGIEFVMPIPDLLSHEASAAAVLDSMAENFDLVVAFFPPPPEGLLSIEGGDGTLGFVVDFVADESKALREAAENLLRHAGAKVVIMGHTHEPQDHPAGLNYINTGSWTRYLRVAEQQVEPSSWSLLAPGAIEHFPYRLLFAEIVAAAPDSVRLNEWKAGS